MKVQGMFKVQTLTPFCAHARQHSVNSVGQWMKVQGKFKMQALTFCDNEVMSTSTAAGQFKCQFKGAMDEMSQKVQNASSHRLILRHTTQGTQSIQWGHGRLHAWVRFGAKLTANCHDTPPTVSIPLGRWMKVQGRFKRRALT